MKGLTSIEVMIIIAIIGFLVAVAYPALTGQRAVAPSQVVCEHGVLFDLYGRRGLSPDGKGMACQSLS